MLKLKVLIVLILTYFSLILTNEHNFKFGFIGKKNETIVTDRNQPFEMQCQYYTKVENNYTVIWLNSSKEISYDLSRVSNYVKQVKCVEEFDNSSIRCFNSVLSFKYVCTYDLSIYECILVQNAYDGDITNKKILTKNVVYKPIEPKVIFNQPNNLCIGSNVILRCEITPITYDMQLYMKRGNQFIGERLKTIHKCYNINVTIFDNQPIAHQINNVTINDSGKYTCEAIYDKLYVQSINLTIIDCLDQPAGSSEYKMVFFGLMLGLISTLSVFVIYCLKRKITGTKITPRYEKSLNVESQKYIFSLEFMNNLSFNFSKEMKLRTLKLIKILGTGEFGEVYLGKATSTNNNKSTLVAVKILKYNKPPGNFMMEKDIMANLGYHENIIRYIGFINLPDKIAIVMEYAKNGSLLNLLKVFQHSPSYVNERLLCQFGIDVASGMEYLSSMNLVHRDLAARNVFISEGWILKIGDFGLTREAYDYYRQINEGKVPIRWLAFESLLFKKYSIMSDVWSFGILLWEIFSLGQTPYSDVTDISLLTNLIVHGKRNFRPIFCNMSIYSIMQKTWHSIALERPTFTDIILELKDLLSTCSSALVRYE